MSTDPTSTTAAAPAPEPPITDAMAEKYTRDDEACLSDPARRRPPDRTANKILTGLSEALRIATLIRAVYEIDGFEMTEKEAMEVLAKLDAVS